MSFLRKRLNSFKYAFRGIGTFFRSQTHPKIHLLAIIFVTSAGFYFNVSTEEWITLILTMTIVLVAEAINSAIEILCDRVTTEYDEQIKNIKDINAGAVLISALASVIIGVIIFLPRVLDHF